MIHQAKSAEYDADQGIDLSPQEKKQAKTHPERLDIVHQSPSPPREGKNTKSRWRRGGREEEKR